MQPGFSLIIENEYEWGIRFDRHLSDPRSWYRMIYSFLPRPIEPVMVFTLPYSRDNFEDIVRHINSNEAVSETRGTIENSFHRQREAMESVLQIAVCLGIFPVSSSVNDDAPPNLNLRLPCDLTYIQDSNFATIAVATVGDSVDAECSKLYKKGE